MKTKEIKTPDYITRAVKKYNEKFDIFTDKLPAGTKERMIAAGFSPSDRVADIMAALEKMEKEKKGTAETEKTHSKTTDSNPTISIIS